MLALVAMLVAPGAVAAARPTDELAIGITQFPSTLHPSIDLMVAKSYVQAMTRRPITTFDAGWHLVCMLCTELPTIENGLAVPVTLPDGAHGIRVTYTLQPEARWGDGVPLTTEDVRFTWEVGREPKSGLANSELYRRITAVEVKDAKTGKDGHGVDFRMTLKLNKDFRPRGGHP